MLKLKKLSNLSLIKPEKAIVEQKINKNLIMGVRIFVLGQEIDLSLKGSYDRLEQNLKNRIEVSG